MANQNNNHGLGWFIYYRDTGEKIRVSKEEHDAFYKDANRIRNKAMHHGRCVCPEYYVWKCDGDCPGCRFQADGDTVSLDEANQDGNSIFDTLPDAGKPVDEMVADRFILGRLCEALRELDPDAETIIRLWKEHPEGISDRAIAKALGRPQKTFADQMKRYRARLKRLI